MKLLDSPKKGKRYTKIAIAILLASVGVVFFSILFGLLTKSILGYSSLSNSQSLLDKYIYRSLGFTFSFGPLALVLFFFVKKYEQRKIETLGFIDSKPFYKFIRGAFWGTIMCFCVLAFMIIFKQVEIQQPNSELRSVTGVIGIFLLLISTLIQASTEEIIFRGWFLPVLNVKLGAVKAIIISSIVFGLIHAFTNLSFLAVFNLTLYGIFLALYAVLDNSIWGVCAWHTFWNWSERTLFGLVENGESKGEGFLLNAKITGNTFLTGGEAGTNGSLFLTIILLSGIFYLTFKLNKRQLLKLN